MRSQLKTGDSRPAWLLAGKGCHVLEAPEKLVTGRDFLGSPEEQLKDTQSYGHTQAWQRGRAWRCFTETKL